MNSQCSNKTIFTNEKLVFSCLIALSLLVSTGCRPVGSGAQLPFIGSSGGGLFGGGGLFNRGNDVVSSATGFAGGFGQSVFGDRSLGGLTGQARDLAGQTGRLFGPNGAVANNGSGYVNPGNAGFQQAGFQQPRLPSLNTQAFAENQNQLASQVNSLNQRVTAYDTDNQLLNTELAALKQKLQLSETYGQTLKQQLADSASQIQQFDLERQGSAQQLATAQLQLQQLQLQNQQAQQQNQQTQQQLADARRSEYGQNPNVNGARFAQAGFAGGSAASLPAASLRANNTLLQRLNEINIPGGQARLDGDVIRIEFPSDNMFVPGTYQLQPTQLPVLQGIVGSIRQSFPKQIVGIEAHWDGTQLTPATTSHHQLTATQALAVFDRLVAMGVPRNQLFTMAMGSNRPRHSQASSNGISPNRRIELVIYPETFDGT